MELSGKQGALTRAGHALKKIINETNEKLAIWRISQEETMITHKKEMDEAFHLLTSKAETLESTMNCFAEVVDSVEDPDGDIVDVGNKQLDLANEILDNFHNTVDILSFQIARVKKTTIRPMEQTAENGQNQRIVQIIDRQNLPKLPKFKGQVWEFTKFWKLFEGIVAQNNSSELIKFNKLMESLEGEPKVIVQEYMMSENKFLLAAEHLRRRYGNEENIVAKLTYQLRNEKAPSYSTKDQRQLLDRLLFLTTQLKDLHENIEGRMIKDVIIEKFANRIREAIFKRKQKSAGDWTLEKVMTDLDEIIGNEEELNRYMNRHKDRTPQNANIRHKNNSLRNEAGDKSAHPSQSENKLWPCIFCKREGHRSSDCKTYPSFSEMVKILEGEKRCRNCLSQQHTTVQCTKPNRECYHCKSKDHHALFCKQQNKPGSNGKDKSFQQKDKHAKTQAAGIALDAQGQMDSESWSTKKEEDSTQEECNSNTTLAKGHETFVPTIETKAFNPKEQRWIPIAHMLDTGSDQSYIKSDLTKAWGLPNHGTRTMNTRVFGYNAPEVKEYQKTMIRLQTGKKLYRKIRATQGRMDQNLTSDPDELDRLDAKKM